jgi:hypothetical protein
MNDERSDAEAKLAAPKLFGRKKAAAPADGPAPAAPVEPVPEAEVLPPAAEPTPAQPVAPEPLEPAPPVTQDRPATTAKPAKEPPAPKPPRQRRSLPKLPRLSGLQVAAVAGIVVGVFLAFATYGTLHVCADVRGAATCGGKAGFPLLLAIGIIAVVGGGALLRAFGVRSPMGDSFLAVALVAVVTVLFFANHYDAWWMLIVVPVLSLAAFVLWHWVSVKYIDPAGESADRVE